MGRKSSSTKRRKLNLSKMATKEIEVIEIDDFSAPPKRSPKPKGTPLRSIFCLKNRDEIAKYEEEEECFILEFDPDEVTSLKIVGKCNDDADLKVVAEKGQVACRDYPHPRHTCVKFPFETTSHDQHCKQCYCYVCDVTAPCSQWTGSAAHCHAYNNEAWKVQREKSKKRQI